MGERSAREDDHEVVNGVELRQTLPQHTISARATGHLALSGSEPDSSCSGREDQTRLFREKSTILNRIDPKQSSRPSLPKLYCSIDTNWEINADSELQPKLKSYHSYEPGFLVSFH